MEYKNKENDRVAIIISNRAAGMCRKTLGTTMVVYKYKEDEYPFVMEHREFYERHSEITKEQQNLK